MSEEELNAIIDERVAEKTIQIETALTDWASDEIARQVKDIPRVQGPPGPMGPMGPNKKPLIEASGNLPVILKANDRPDNARNNEVIM